MLNSNRVLVVGAAGSGHREAASQLADSLGAWLLNLDPADQDPLPPCTITLRAPDGALDQTHFVGSLSLIHDPLASQHAVWSAIERAGNAPLVAALPIQAVTPVGVHALRMITRALRPARCIRVGDMAVEHILGVTEVEEHSATQDRLGPRADRPKRKAWWTEYLARCSDHEVPLNTVRVRGGRLGAGIRLSPADVAEIRRIGVEGAVYAEVCGNTLFILTNEAQGSDYALEAADAFGCQTAHLAAASSYRGLVVAAENAAGKVFAVGRNREFDPFRLTFHVLAPIEPPMPIETLLLGRLRIGEDGDEIGVLKPWQV
jgi:polynucleotide 5'-kinase involved in rRNA processing